MPWELKELRILHLLTRVVILLVSLTCFKNLPTEQRYTDERVCYSVYKQVI